MTLAAGRPSGTIHAGTKKAAPLEAAFYRRLHAVPGPRIPRQAVPEGVLQFFRKRFVAERLRLLVEKFAEIPLFVKLLECFQGQVCSSSAVCCD